MLKPVRREALALRITGFFHGAKVRLAALHTRGRVGQADSIAIGVQPAMSLLASGRYAQARSRPLRLA